MDKTDNYSVVLRRYYADSDSDRYSILDSFQSTKEAADAVVNCLYALEYGDIVYICDTAEIVEINKKCFSLYVADKYGKPQESHRHMTYCSRTTSDLVENYFHKPEAIIWFTAKQGVPRLEIVSAIICCFEYIYGTKETDTTSSMKQIAHEYANGGDEPKGVKEKIGNYLSNEDVASGAYSLKYCLEVSCSRNYYSEAQDSIESMLYHVGSLDIDRVRDELRHLIIKIIPLRMILLARVGCLR